MRRKDLLIIVASAIILTFSIVLGICCVVNKENTKQGISEIFESNGQYYSNGWEKAIVSEIIHDIPIPVGFTYVEGDKKTGLIIKNNNTNEEYMWIPYIEDIEIHIDTELRLKGNTKETKDSILEYNGFFVAIESVEEKYDRYLRENTNDTLRYVELKNIGYEVYKKAYEEQVGEEFNLNKISQEEIEELELKNESKTEVAETHLITIEEKAFLEKYEEMLGKTIFLKDYKALTLANHINTDKEDQVDQSKWDKNIVATTKYDVPIPQGFVYREGTVETGFVVEQEGSENLRFIWIPVEDVNTVKDTFLKHVEEAELDEELLIEPYKTYKDEEGEEYDKLVESIEIYGGFYVSEAELGYDEKGNDINIYREMYLNKENGNYHVTNGDYYRNIKGENKQEGLNSKEGEVGYFKLTYKNAKEKCEELYEISESVVSHLTYGLEYDAVVNYLIENGVDAEKVFRDSTEIGKYANSDKIKVWEQKKLLNGIYGLAGNLAEITQEKDGGKIVVRGGSWETQGNVQQLASKAPKTEEDIISDEETIGFRACLYIKTDYEGTDKVLDNAKLDAKTEFTNYLNGNISNKDASVIQEITKCINTKIDDAKSGAALEEIVNKGIDASKQIEKAINDIIIYPDLENYYGATSDACWEIKKEAIEQIKELKWNEEGIFKNSNGETATLNEIIAKSEQDITEEREKYRTKVITEYIDDYVPYGGTSCQEIIDKIKTKAKESELKCTEDFDNIMGTVEKWHTIIETANGFNEYCPSGEEYNSAKIKYLDKIANTTTVEEAKAIDKEGRDEIDKIKNKTNSTQEETPGTTTGTEKYVFVGDSRFVAMGNVCKQNNDTFISEVGAGLKELKRDESSILNAVTKGSIVIIGYGINDYADANKVNEYTTYVHQLAGKLKEKGATTYFLTINPVELDGQFAKKDWIESYNEQFKNITKINGENINYKILDMYDYVYGLFGTSGHGTTDGVHYKNATTKAIYNYIKEHT